MDPAKSPEGPAMRRFRLDSFAGDKAKGGAEAVLTKLYAGDVSVSSVAKRRFLACTDLKVLGEWLSRAPNVFTRSRWGDYCQAF